MQIIDADHTRMIDLAGVGPCPRPVDIDEAATGFQTLKSLRIYSFAKGQVIEGESEGDEVYVVPLGGIIALTINGAHPLATALSTSGPRAVYMPPNHAYRLVPQTDVSVAYARAVAAGTVATHTVDGPTGDRAETLRFTLADLADGDSVDHSTSGERLIHIVQGALTTGVVAVAAPQTIALSPGEDADLRAKGKVQVLIVSH